MKSLRALAAQSPALVVSVAALFFSLGSGAGYAATLNSGSASATTALTSASVQPRSTLKWTDFELGKGWHGGSHSGGMPAYAVSGGVVYLRGSVDTTAKSPSYTIAVLPKADRPSHWLYLPVYTFRGSEGSLYIEPNGEIVVYSVDSDSKSYTSIAGISFPIGA